MKVKGQSLVLGNMPTRRPDARTPMFGPGGPEDSIQKIEIQELSSMSRITQNRLKMIWLHWSKNLVLKCFISIKDFIKQFNNISEEAVLASSARCETAVSMELRSAQLFSIGSLREASSPASAC